MTPITCCLLFLMKGSLFRTRCLSCGHEAANYQSPICAALEGKGWGLTRFWWIALFSCTVWNVALIDMDHIYFSSKCQVRGKSVRCQKLNNSWWCNGNVSIKTHLFEIWDWYLRKLKCKGNKIPAFILERACLRMIWCCSVKILIKIQFWFKKKERKKKSEKGDSNVLVKGIYCLSSRGDWLTQWDGCLWDWFLLCWGQWCFSAMPLCQYCAGPDKNWWGNLNVCRKLLLEQPVAVRKWLET